MKDWKSIGRIVRSCNQPPAIIASEDRRIAIADEDLRMDILGQQGSPGKSSCRTLLLPRVSVGHSHFEVGRELAEESGEILLRRRRHEVVLAASVAAHVEPETVACIMRNDGELHGKCGLGTRALCENPFRDRPDDPMVQAWCGPIMSWRSIRARPRPVPCSSTALPAPSRHRSASSFNIIRRPARLSMIPNKYGRTRWIALVTFSPARREKLPQLALPTSAKPS